MIEVSFLGSGSSGNCAVVRSGKTVVLLDAGLSVKETRRRLLERGVALEGVSALLLTHEHSDHVRSASAVAERLGIPVYASDGTAAGARLPGPLFFDRRRVRGGETLTFGGGELSARVTATPHDGTEPVCYVFEAASGHRAGIVTDLGHLSEPVLSALADCDVLGLEANHDVDLLRAGPYPPFLKKRILSQVGHLSNDAAGEGLARLVGPRTRALVLLHLSQHNNTPALAARTVGESLTRLGAKVPLEVASPNVPTRWYGA